ncbi:hypothetical protein Ocin01_13876 [Orchesella cincta]|uniref:Uncharacterized protein n=1 Tax=Orchesella cincta TaxID=48709 RepID=A0A1D2MIH8_ORCCI|nr:hypothetical protein Ocin01_13876 [Orchesella cincta]
MNGYIHNRINKFTDDMDNYSPRHPLMLMLHRLADIYGFYHMNIGALLQREISLETNRDDEYELPKVLRKLHPNMQGVAIEQNQNLNGTLIKLSRNTARFLKLLMLNVT